MTTRFEETVLSRFTLTDARRTLRIGAGSARIGAGLGEDGSAGAPLAVAGLVPLGAGTLDICIPGRCLGASHRGSEIRAASRAPGLDTGDAGSPTTSVPAEA